PADWIVETCAAMQPRVASLRREILMTIRDIFFLILLPGLTASGQVLMEQEGQILLHPSDAATLEGREHRTDLPCKVTATKPELGFDLEFHSGYEVSLPLAELSGSGNSLTAIFRVIPETDPDKAVYFSQKWTVPSLT